LGTRGLHAALQGFDAPAQHEALENSARVYSRANGISPEEKRRLLSSSAIRCRPD
jgi:hypothetical protein